jgi:hypothetical protein
MPGLVPGIHVLIAASIKDVDGRDKPGHDEGTLAHPRRLEYQAYAFAFAMKSGRSALLQSGTDLMVLFLIKISACCCM